MFWKKYNWYKVAETEAEIKLNRNGIGIFEVTGKKVCVTKYLDVWYAFAYHCPHAGGLMSEGYVDLSGNIVCPVHAYKFNLKNGRCDIPDSFRLKTFRVELRPDGFYIGME